MVAYSDILVGSSSGFSLKYQFENLPNLLHKFSFKIYSLKIRREKIEVDLLGLIRSILKGQIRSFETWISNTDDQRVGNIKSYTLNNNKYCKYDYKFFII